jgi:type IV secretion system protein VirD4
MVSRSETARQLLTPGEIMQLPHDDEIVMVAGSPPIRAKKARYFEDKRFVDRVVPPPEPRKGDPVRQDDPWSSLPTIEADEPLRASAPSTNADEANAGLRREPNLPEHVAIAPEKAAELAREFEMMLDDEPEEAARQRRVLQRQMGRVARQASMDRNDGIDL